MDSERLEESLGTNAYYVMYVQIFALASHVLLTLQLSHRCIHYDWECATNTSCAA